MTDSDDAVSRRYREHAREEPPAAADAAILAASRRAVGARPGSARWAVPVSIAAVLVLGIGVSLRMQLEEPGIETSAPASEYPVPQASDEAAPPPTAKPEVAASAPTPVEPARPVPAPRREAARTRPPVPREAASPRQEAIAAQAPVPGPAPAPAAPASEGVAAELRDEARQKRASAPLAAKSPPPMAALRAARDPLEAELERIARLRAEGRHDEADKSLEAFRREHPQYRIPEAVWERVKPR